MRKRVRGVVCASAVTVFGAAFAGSALAQGTAPPPPPPHEGSVDASYLATSGNTSTTTLGLGGNVIFRPAPWTIENRVGFVRSEAENVVNANTFRYQFRALRKVNARLSTYGQYDFLRDVLSGVSQRNDVTGGLDYQMVSTARQSFAVFGGLGYSNEHRVGVPVPNPDRISTGVFDTGWKYKLKLSDNADFTDDFRYALGFDRGENWRLGHIAAVTAKVNTLLSLKFTTTVRYVNFPPTGLKKTDTTTSVALVAKF